MVYFAVILSDNYKGHLATWVSGLVKKKAPKLFVYNDYNYRKQKHTKRTKGSTLKQLF